MKQLTVQEALQNIDIVVSNAQMIRTEHHALQQSIMLVTQRCKVADELEKGKEDGRTEQPPNIPRTDQKSSK